MAAVQNVSHRLTTDPVPAGPLGMSLFLASEAMFLVGMLGSFLVLQAGNRELFHHAAAVLVTWETTALAVLLVIASGVVVFKRSNQARQLAAVVAALGFIVCQLLICGHLLRQHTIVARVDSQLTAYDGSADGASPIQLTGVRTPLPERFDVSRLIHSDLATAGSSMGTFVIPTTTVLQDVSYGPWRNNFLAAYFLLAGSQLVHMLAGIAGMFWLMVRTARGTATASNLGCVQLYWHFVNAAGLLGLVLIFFA